jgi:DNA-binding transcriptional MerR regulator
MLETSATAPPRPRLSTADTSKYTGIAESTLRYYRHIGTGPASYTISSRVFYDIADIDAWVAAEKAKSLRGGVR